MLPDNFNHVLFEELPTKTGMIGIATLNRPEALNALSVEMIFALNTKYQQWAVDPNIHAVVLQSKSTRAFCAGGDLKQLYLVGKANVEQTVPFFRYEYELNKFVHHFPKPYISLVEGINMGGGLGISVLGAHVVAGENLRMAMPETAIGFYPDVGGTFFLARCPHFIGMYMGLTGNAINIADAILAQLVQTHTPADKFPAIIAELCQQDLSTAARNKIINILQQFHTEPGASVLTEHLPIISQCFKHDSVEAIFAALQQHDSVWAKEQFDILQKRSPTSLKVTHKGITVGANLDLDANMALEFNLTYEVLQGHDIYEGIRAVLIDKTNDPKWQPARLQDVSAQLIEEIFRIKWKL